ncbi:DNA methyltransferase [uncultured Chryseobacterium sp.]|uniref:DNA methyltransferase n=1 Tax=uncultured Chryseobacterium sp. TaxID=259322 RepID=UPI002600BF33|nr:DNA methyltransferase [uncultured Chryseobacterium sp.]
MNYEEFLKNKIIISEDFGFEVGELSSKLHLHQPDIVRWSLRGGRRAIFASFGLGKSMMRLDIIERLIYRFTNEGDTVNDCFGGLFSTPYVALELKRKAKAVELNTEYFNDGVSYINAINHQINMPTLFDFV